MKLITFFFAGFFAVSSLQSQVTEHIILPSQTDPAIDGNSVANYCYLNPAVSPINKLLVFFPGTNAEPWDYRLFQQTAAGMGYHVIGLSYENLESINIDICPATHDSTCHRRARYEIWFGQDTHDSLDVTYSNSVMNRLLKLLNYLDNHYPTENWGQYLVNDSTVLWQNVVTAGHSQGAGNATFGTKYFEVSRVIMFSWVDWMWPGKNPDWINIPGPTPDSAYYGFIHTGDASIYYGIPTTWNNLGMTPYGPITSIDTSAYPYNLTHSVITSMAIDTTPTQTNYHNSTVVDWVTPIDGVSGMPELKTVWEYLLRFNPLSTETDEWDRSGEIIFFPNPAKDYVFVEALSSNRVSKLEIFNMQGICIYTATDVSKIDCSQWASGIYTVLAYCKNEVIIQKIVKL